MSGLFEIIAAKNPEIEMFRVDDLEFYEYGRVISGFDTTELIKAAESIAMPENGSRYTASAPELEACSEAKQYISDEIYGEMPIQMGYCWGYNDTLNALEWHRGSEINIAVKPLVLILGRVQDIKNGRLDSSKTKAFFVEKGQMIEVYATTLHFCPCMVQDSGFGALVVLPEGTNKPLERTATDSMLFAKNKWLIAHEDNAALITRGAVAGICGENYVIKR